MARQIGVYPRGAPDPQHLGDRRGGAAHPPPDRARVGDRWAVERRFLRPLPHPPPDADLHLETRVGRYAFVRAVGVDYSVPPAFVGRHR